MPAISLRIVIGMITAVIVLVVASVTLAITYTVSISAVHSNGNQLAEAIVNNVALQVEQYVGMPEKHLFALQNMTKTYNVVLPPDDPGYADGSWGYRYRSFIQGQSLESNYSYSSIAILWNDGSTIVALDFLSRGYATENIQTWRNRTLPNGTIQSYAAQNNVMYNIKTKRPWNVTEQGPMPITLNPSDARTAGYKSILQLNKYEEKCVWFPPAIDGNEAGNPKYLLYGICILYNFTGTLIGTANVGRYLDNVNEYLRKTSKTDNTQLFVVDNFKYLVATTHTTKAMAYYPAGTPITEGCSSSRAVTSSGAVAEIIGCRVPAKTFPYAPLNDVVAKDPDFVVAEGRRAEYGKLDGEVFYYVSQRIPSKLTGYTMNLVLFMPENDILGGIVTGRNIAIGVTVAVFVVAAALSFILVGALLAPIDEVARRMYYTSQLTTEKEQRRLAYMSEQEGDATSMIADDDSQIAAASEDLDAPLKRSAMVEIRSLQAAYNTMDTAIKSFTRYVPRDVVKELMATNQMCEIQMRPMRCSMLFTDIANFTTLCEKVPTPVLSSLVRLYFEQSSKTVMKHGGIIDKFIGDCIMVVWGAPVPIDHQEIRSAICGRMLVYETEQKTLRKAFSDVDWDLSIRVGVASGEVLAGNMGSQMRMNYTVIGDEVNLASRLEGLNKQWGTNVMISETTAEECVDFLALRKVISIQVVGKDEPVIVYEVLGVRPDADTERFGALSQDASTEAQSVNQMQQEEDFKMMEERYGVKRSKRNKVTDYVPLPNQPKSTGALLSRAMRKVPVPDEEVRFARVYESGLQLWNKGDFAACVDTLRKMESDLTLPTAAFQRKSVQRILDAAEQRMKSREGVDPSWNGVWTASEK